jgi:hypothetical protein
MAAWWAIMDNADGKKKQESPFTGLWHIVFILRPGYMDWRPGTRDVQPAVEWTWEGTDGADMTEMTGRGWAKLEDDDLHGMTFIHLGDESDSVAKRAMTQRRPKRK